MEDANGPGNCASPEDSVSCSQIPTAGGKTSHTRAVVFAGCCVVLACGVGFWRWENTSYKVWSGPVLFWYDHNDHRNGESVCAAVSKMDHGGYLGVLYGTPDESIQPIIFQDEESAEAWGDSKCPMFF